MYGINEIPLEKGLEVISFPPTEPCDYPSKEEVLRRLHSLKLFSVDSFLAQHFIDKDKLLKVLQFHTKEHYERLLYEFSHLCLPCPIFSLISSMVSSVNKETTSKVENVNSVLSCSVSSSSGSGSGDGDDDGTMNTAVSSNCNDNGDGFCYSNYYRKRLTLGCEGAIDDMLYFVPGHLTEVFGEGGTGKSNLCLQLIVRLLLSDQNASAVYIQTDPCFAGDRLSEICRYSVMAMPKRSTSDDHAKNIDGKSMGKDIEIADDEIVSSVLGRVHVRQVHSFDSFDSLLCKELDGFCGKQRQQGRPIRLVIVDSITSVYRPHFAMNKMFERSEALFRHGICLKNLAERFQLYLIVVNQVSMKISDCPTVDHDLYSTINEFDNNGNSSSCSINSYNDNNRSYLVPSLGLSWSNIVSTRIKLTKNSQIGSMIKPDDQSQKKQEKLQDHSSPPQFRQMSIIFSSYLPEATCRFLVENRGISNVRQ